VPSNASNYARLERAVTNALRETVGVTEAAVLEGRLRERFQGRLNMPRSQAMLLALREVLPQVADAVLERSGRLYSTSASQTR
jgi:hypothetical protein